jgi:hypothetical protein
MSAPTATSTTQLPTRRSRRSPDGDDAGGRDVRSRKSGVRILPGACSLARAGHNRVRVKAYARADLFFPGISDAVGDGRSRSAAFAVLALPGD